MFLQDRLEHLRQQCGPHVTAVAKDSVEGICSKIYQLSAEYSRRLRETHMGLLQDPATGTPELTALSIIHFGVVLTCFSHRHAEVPESPQPSRLVYCYPVRLAIPTPSLPRVELHFENDVACLRFKGEMVKVNRGHFSKLVGTDCSSVRMEWLYFEMCSSQRGQTHFKGSLITVSIKASSDLIELYPVSPVSPGAIVQIQLHRRPSLWKILVQSVVPPKKIPGQLSLRQPVSPHLSPL